MKENSVAGVLPHGPGIRLVCDYGLEADGWVSFSIRLSRSMSVVASEYGTAVPELGLEIMAQACGMVAARQALHDTHSSHRDLPQRMLQGVVGAVRNYEFEVRSFSVEEDIAVRVRPDLVEAHLVVCDCELYRVASEVPSQRARITIVMQ